MDEISPRVVIVIRQKRIFNACTELYKVMKEVLGLHDKVKCLFVGLVMTSYELTRRH